MHGNGASIDAEVTAQWSKDTKIIGSVSIALWIVWVVLMFTLPITPQK
jgi:hypothetical protein